jgi:hypothetical protein
LRRGRAPTGPIILRVDGDYNPVAGDSNLEREQCATGAGPASAFTGIRFVKGAVSPTGQKPAILVEKLVRPPIERCSGMDAMVDITVIAPAEVHDEGFNKPLPPENVELDRATGGDFRQGRAPYGRVHRRIAGNVCLFHGEEGASV